MGALPQRASVLLRFGGEQSDIPAATERQAGVMTAQQVSDLTQLLRWQGSVAGGGAAIPLQVSPTPMPTATEATETAVRDLVMPVTQDITALLARVEALEKAAAAKSATETIQEPIALPVVVSAEPQVAVVTKLAAFPTPTTQITSINIGDATTLRLIILALLAERDGVRGGDTKWHGGKSNFVWPDPETGEVVEMDVDDFLDLARSQLAAEAGE